MGQQPAAMHVARIRSSHVDRQGRRRDYESRYLRRTYRDGAKVRHETLASLSGLPDQAVDAIEGGEQTLSNLAAYVTEIVRKGAEG